MGYIFKNSKCNNFHRVWKKKLHDRTDTAPHTPMTISKCLGKNNRDTREYFSCQSNYFQVYLIFLNFNFSDKLAGKEQEISEGIEDTKGQ